jgi:hypothetical protein
VRKGFGLIYRIGIAQTKRTGDLKLSLNFKVRAARDAQELTKFSGAQPSCSFRYVAWNGDCGSSELAG